MPIYLEVILVFVWVYLWVYLLWAVGVTYIEILTIFTRCLLNSIGVLLIEHLDLHYFIGWTLQKEKISTCCHVCNVFHLQRSFLHAYFEHGDTRGCFPDTRSFGSELVSYCFGSHVQRLAASCERFPILGMGKNSENQQKGNHPIERMDDCWLDLLFSATLTLARRFSAEALIDNMQKRERWGGCKLIDKVYRVWKWI